MRDKAAELLGVDPKEIEYFEAHDQYNGNYIEGFLCKRGDHRYGALVICKVNGEETALQRIYATPKLHYPFGKDKMTAERKYHWPKLRKAYVYEKFDGTNICAYSYSDASGLRYVTFKTRLTPVLRESQFGNFKGMWDEMISKYPGLRRPDAVYGGDLSLSFELYGYRNPLLIEYPIPLEAVLLFGVQQSDAQVIPGSVLKARGACPEAFSPVAQVEHSVGRREDITAVYNKLREDALKRNKKTDEGKIVGSEGFVFYVLTADSTWQMFKAKSEDIEAVHWASDSIHPNSVLTTVWNALENVDVDGLTPKYVAELLAEEFSDIQIQKSMDRVKKSIATVKSVVAFRVQVAEHLKTVPCELNFDLYRKTIMRHMSQFFDKKDMRKVFTAIRELGYVETGL